MNFLIVDDSRLNRVFASSLIGKNNLGLTVYFAENGEEALESIRDNNIDIVLLDIIMPGIDGVETLRRIVSTFKQNIKVIMYSTISDGKSLEQCFEIGAVDFIHKPIEEMEFIARLNSVIKQKQLEDERITYVKEIEAQKMIISESNIQLMQQEKMAGIGQLAAGVAHEINNPLGFISSNLSVLKEYVTKFYAVYNLFESDLEGDILLKAIENFIRTEDFKFIFEDLEDLFEETDIGLTRVTEIVKSLRNFSRIDMLEAFDSYNINDGLKDTLIIANNSIKYSANIKTEYGEMVNIDAIGGQINQVLLNMVLNAADAVKNRHDSGMGNIVIKTYIENHYVVFSIKDDGTGIDDDHLSSLFNPFFTTKPIGKGLGLGLSMSYDIIVNKHCGKIDVKSVINEGTEFIVYLPIENKNKSAL
jgi:signal transduction histidine kinase